MRITEKNIVLRPPLINNRKKGINKEDENIAPIHAGIKITGNERKKNQDVRKPLPPP